ncbi:MAG TPA: DUF2442 domain-containing protein [Patescibacteria group bacterium]|nr:DUF2442 domain-containing protein [Patescibacteria group bacterium]
MGRITKIILGDDYQVTIKFDNNHSVSLDMEQKLHTARFSELRDRHVFCAAKTDGKSVCWPGGISLAISEILELVAK